MISDSFFLNLLALVDSLPLSCCQHSFIVWTPIPNNWSIVRPPRTQLFQYSEPPLPYNKGRPLIFNLTTS